MTRLLSHRLLRARRLALVLALACVCLVAASCPVAFADEFATGGELGIGALSDRYGQLKDLGSSLTEEESVVIETRVGVLTSVNRALDESEVRFTGEVVGDVVNAGPGYKWVNASGAANTVISVYMPDDQAKDIKYKGGYHARGTSLKMTGVYHVACPEHQGELDVHTTSVELVDAGGPIKHKIKPRRAHATFVFCTLGIVMIAGFFLTRNYFRSREDD